MPSDTIQAGHLRNVPLDELRAEAQAQERSFTRGESSDDAAGLELFRRAVVGRDAAAWAAVVEIYRGLLLAQTGRRAVRGLVTEDDGFCVDRAFQRFWMATNRRQQHQFDDLASILKYLKMCLGSVLLDEARARRRQACASIDDISPDAWVSADPAAEVLADATRQELWRTIDAELQDPNERLLARLSFVAGLSPKDIIARHPDRFEDVFDVYRTKRNMIERLRRSPRLRELLD